MKRFIVFLSATVLLAGLAFAQADQDDMSMGCPMGGMGMHGGKGMMGSGGAAVMAVSRMIMMRQQLGLSDDQVSRLRSIRADAIKSAATSNANLKVALLDVFDGLAQPNPNFDDAKKKVADAAKLWQDNATAMIDSYQKALGVLTDDQKTKFFQMPMMMHRGMQSAPQKKGK